MSDQIDEASSEREKHSGMMQCTNCGHWLKCSGIVQCKHCGQWVKGKRRRSDPSKRKDAQGEIYAPLESLPRKKPEANPKTRTTAPLTSGSILIGAGMICLTILACFWVWYIASEKNNKPLARNDEKAVTSKIQSKSKASNQSETENTQAPAHMTGVAEILTRYFKAENWSERLPLVRKTPQVEQKMKSWYAWHKDESFLRVAADRTMTQAGGYFVIKLHGDGLPSNHIVLEKIDEEYRVDWESFVIYQDLDWAKIQEEKSTEIREIRCILESVENIHQELTSEKGYYCYKLIHPVTKKVMISYYNAQMSNDNDSGLGQSLSQASKGRYTLGVSYPEKGELGQDLIISRVLAKGWVLR